MYDIYEYRQAARFLMHAVEEWSNAVDRESSLIQFIKSRGLYAEFRKGVLHTLLGQMRETPASHSSSTLAQPTPTGTPGCTGMLQEPKVVTEVPLCGEQKDGV